MKTELTVNVGSNPEVTFEKIQQNRWDRKEKTCEILFLS